MEILDWRQITYGITYCLLIYLWIEVYMNHTQYAVKKCSRGWLSILKVNSKSKIGDKVEEYFVKRFKEKSQYILGTQWWTQ